MPSSKKYNGYSSYNAWNISLWIHKDEALHKLAQECVEEYDTREIASAEFIRAVGTKATPDGAPWSKTNVQLAMREL